jgi:hypothetical protein
MLRNLAAVSEFRVNADTSHPSPIQTSARADPKYPQPIIVILLLTSYFISKFYHKSQV